MDPRPDLDLLLGRFAELRDLSGAAAVLSWDQETHMPRGGAAARAVQMATLASLRHEKLCDARVGEALARCEEARRDGAFDEETEAALREMRRSHDQATRLPAELVRESAQAESAAMEAWRDAREADDFGAFAPRLEQLVDLARRRADALGWEESRYDALLDLYERGATEARIGALFTGLREALAPMVAEAVERCDPRDLECIQGPLDLDAQRRLGDEVVKALGFDLERGRIDLSTHPFCSSMGHGDTRLTRRFDPRDLRPGLYGVIHEAGHGLYEQGLPAQWARHPLGGAASLGVHESQSRFWENVVGRSLPFCEWLLPRLRHHFPGRFDELPVEDLHRALNHVEATFVRVEADELTYNLHVVLRFEVERRLLAGDLAVREVPELWRTTMRELLGIEPPDHRLGCLQDVHWSMGAFGYFPTYTLGNLYAAQLDRALRRDLGDVDSMLRAGNFRPVLDWMRERVHQHASRYLPAELIERATGEPPSEEPFLAAMRGRFGGTD